MVELEIDFRKNETVGINELDEQVKRIAENNLAKNIQD